MSTDAATLPDALSDAARSFAAGPHRLVIGAVQGFAVGAWGANPIIITIGAAGLMEGMAVWLSHGKSIIPPIV